MLRRRRRNPWKGVVLGSIAGAAGVVAMDYFMKATSGLVSEDGKSRFQRKSISLVGRQHKDGESATEAAGRILYRAVTGKEPKNPEVKTLLSNTVHWSFGMDMGAAYGAARQGSDGMDLLGGLALGAGLWLAGDEVAVPLLGLADNPASHPPSMHLQTLGGHLVYGVVTAGTFQLLNRLAGGRR